MRPHATARKDRLRTLSVSWNRTVFVAKRTNLQRKQIEPARRGERLSVDQIALRVGGGLDVDDQAPSASR
jgi:hypothetical protein